MGVLPFRRLLLMRRQVVKAPRIGDLYQVSEEAISSIGRYRKPMRDAFEYLKARARI